MGRSGLVWRLFLVGCVAATACGCIRSSVDQGVTVYSYESYVPWLVLAACILAVPVGWLLRNFSGRLGGLGWLLLIGGPLAAVGVAPAFWLDHVTIDDRHFELKTGFWFWPTEHEVAFEGLSLMAITSETKRGRRGRKIVNYSLECTNQAGATTKVPVGDMMKHALQDICDHAEAGGVQVVNLVQEE